MGYKSLYHSAKIKNNTKRREMINTILIVVEDLIKLEKQYLVRNLNLVRDNSTMLN